ncbi:unnamed protein product, partial [marine sediment metagenome]
DYIRVIYREVNNKDKFYQVVNYWVSPKKDEHSVSGLNKLLMNCLNPLEPLFINEFSLTSSELKLGSLYFNEVMGKQVINTKTESLINWADNFCLNKELYENKSIKKLTRKLTRGIKVVIFPNKDLAYKAVYNKFNHSRNPLVSEQSIRELDWKGDLTIKFTK